MTPGTVVDAPPRTARTGARVVLFTVAASGMAMMSEVPALLPGRAGRQHAPW